MNTSVHLDDFKQEMMRRNYAKNSIDNYVSCLSMFFSQSKSDHPKNIHEKEIKDFLSKKEIVNTQRNYHSAIKKYFEIILGQKDKFKYIPYARKEQKLPIVLSKDEIQKMFSVCDNKKHKVILALLYSCGLRVSELINLKWEHIDRSRMVINVIQAKGKKDRQVMLAPQLIPLLEDYYREYKSRVFVNVSQTRWEYLQKNVAILQKSINFA